MFRIFPLRILMVIIASTSNSLGALVPEDYCDLNNTVCVSAISNIIINLDGSYDPCDDYYQYVCKQYQYSTTVPSDHYFWNQFKEVDKKTDEELSSQLGTEHSTVMIQKMANFYQSCLNRSNELYYYPETVTEFMSMIGGWPLIGQDIFADFDWMEAVASVYRNTDAENIIFFIGTITYNSTNEYLMIHQPYKNLMWLPSTVEEVAENFVNYIKNIVQEIYPQYTQNQQILDDIEDTAEFCLRYVQILSDDIDSESFQIMSMEQIQAQTEFDFKKLVQFILKDVMIVTDDTKIMIRNMEFIRRLKELISDYSDKMRIVASYIGLIAAKQLQLEIKKRNNATPKEQFCLDLLFEYMTYGAGVLLANNIDRYTVTQDVGLMTNEIKRMIETDVNATSWIDANSKASFLKKLRNLKITAIGPLWMDDASFVGQYYRNIGNISSDNYMQNIITLEKFRKLERFKMYGRQLNIDDGWKDAMYLSSVYYNNYLNALYIPALSLKPPFYHPSYNQAMKFGSLGVMIAEGIMNAFDNENIYIDESGQKNDSLWKEPISHVIYEDYMDCLTQRFDNFTTPLIPYQVSGTLHKDDNFALSMGLVEAYKAFKNLTARENVIYYGPEEKKINYLKLFFLNFAYMKCEKLTEDPNSARTLLLLNYMPQKHKVIGSISNSRDFYQIFQCYLFSNTKIFGDGRGRCNFWREVPAKK